MNIFQSVIFGIVQGIAEFLPISSSGHLVVLKELFGLEEVPRLFDVLMHIPTLLVVLVIFRSRIISIFKSLFRWVKRIQTVEDAVNFKLCRMIIVATIPLAFIGVGIKLLLDYFEESAGIDFFRNYPEVVGILFLVTAAFLIASRFFKGTKSYEKMGLKSALLIGIAQSIGVLPGISRSGITITAASMTGIDRKKAGEFSFLISIPAILGASVVELRGITAMQIEPLALAAGLLTCLVVGFVSLVLLLKLIKNGRLYLFSIYLIPVGILSLLFL